MDFFPRRYLLLKLSKHFIHSTYRESFAFNVNQHGCQLKVHNLETKIKSWRERNSRSPCLYRLTSMSRTRVRLTRSPWVLHPRLRGKWARYISAKYKPSSNKGENVDIYLLALYHWIIQGLSSLVPTICPWVSEDGVHRVKLSKVCYRVVFCVVTQSSSTKGGALRDQQISLKHGPRTAGCPTGASLSSLLHFNRDFHDYLTRFRFNLHKISLRYQFSICSPRLFGTISSWLSVTAFIPPLTLKRN